MTSLSIERTANGVRVGVRPAHPEHTALCEAAGAVLCWDILSPAGAPTADIDDVHRAAEWLSEIYGVDAAAEILAFGGAETVDRSEIVAEAGPTAEVARRLAHLRWASAWWPASAGVAPLSRALLHAELAMLTATCEHVLDDEEAVERALRAASGSPPALSALGAEGPLGAHANELLDQLLELAETFGVELAAATAPAAPQSADFALAAGGDVSLLQAKDEFYLQKWDINGGAEATGAGVVVASGTAEFAWADFPAGMVDAAADASWSIRRLEGEVRIVVSVPCAPEVRFPLPEPSHPGALSATLTMGADTVQFDLARHGPGYRGSAALSPAALLHPAGARVLRVVSPDVAGDRASAPLPDTIRSAIIAEARRRLAHPVSLAEHAAARASSKG